jgi:hypothetical protein
MSVLTFEQFLRTTAAKGEAMNTLFEERLFELVGVLHRIVHVISEQRVPCELIGGLAVLVHVEEADPEHSMLTRDVDLMIDRADLERIKTAAAGGGFRFSYAGGENSARNSVHLIFKEEMSDPPLASEKKWIHGGEVTVIPVADLVRMKLSSYRLNDRVHVRSMDAAGLITPEVEAKLPLELSARLQHVRDTE